MQVIENFFIENAMQKNCRLLFYRKRKSSKLLQHNLKVISKFSIESVIQNNYR